MPMIERGNLSDEEWQDLKRRWELYLNPTGLTPTSKYSDRYWGYTRRVDRQGKVLPRPNFKDWQ